MNDLLIEKINWQTFYAFIEAIQEEKITRQVVFSLIPKKS